MKIICVDNFDRDYIDDKLICNNIDNFYGEYIVDFLNGKFSGNDSPDFYRLVHDDYQLREFQP